MPTDDSRSGASGATGSSGSAWMAPGSHISSLYAMARPSQTTPKPRPRPSGKSSGDDVDIGPPPPPPLYGATFELIIGPSKPIVGVVRIEGDGSARGRGQRHGGSSRRRGPGSTP